MSYAKIAKLCQDAPLSFADVNQLRDNALAQRDLYDVAHGIDETFRGYPPPPASRAGRHDTPLVSRAVVDVVPTTLSYGVTVPGLGNVLATVVSVSRSATGIYFVQLTGLRFYAGHGRAKQTSISNDYHVRVVPVYPTATSALVGLAVETFELQSGGLSYADFDFSVVVYGEV